MRIYNGTDSLVSLPYVGNQRINVEEHSVSGDLGATNELLSSIVSAYGTDELAVIVSGPYELNLCASIPTVNSYVVQSLDEAISRFSPVAAEPEMKESGDDSCEECGCTDECCPSTSSVSEGTMGFYAENLCEKESEVLSASREDKVDAETIANEIVNAVIDEKEEKSGEKVGGKPANSAHTTLFNSNNKAAYSKSDKKPFKKA